MKANFIEAVLEQFEMHKDDVYAKQMEKKMKYAYPYIGINNSLRSRIFKYLYPDYETEIKTNLIKIVNNLFDKEEREFHLIALDIIKKNIIFLSKVEYFPFIKDLILKKPNYDTVDFISKDILGEYLLRIPELTKTIMNLLIHSNNTWKIRAAILFQIKYHEKTNQEMLFSICEKFINTTNFYIHQAIVIALKQYKKYNSEAINYFITKHDFLLEHKDNTSTEFDKVKKLIHYINMEKAVI